MPPNHLASSQVPSSRVLSGHPLPLGAHPESGGVRFAVASSTADAVEVCLIAEDGTERRYELTEHTFGIWHGVIQGVLPGQHYGFRTHGAYDPTRGLRHNPAKLLVDPYAKRITGGISNLDAAFGYTGDPMADTPNMTDSLGSVPLSIVTSRGGPDTGPAPEVPFEETIIYELHVRGFTQHHPEVPEQLRGTYLGLAHPAVLEYLAKLGVTTVELMPVHTFMDEPWLVESGRSNYWGYSPLGFFAPHPAYASEPGREVEEFRTMVAALHAVGIEVLVDMVFNHTCEGGLDGPTLSFRGFDAPAYYLQGEDGHAFDITGCGNTLNTGSPTVVRLVTDSLRYWAGELGVDGFRFDLGSVLGRPWGGPFDPNSALLTAISCDPLLASRKLIAEPWDATGDGYRIGAFGSQWAEWNGRFRDTVRDFWRGATGVRDLAYRLSGSSDLYGDDGRRPWASINFITAHDGFTLRDLVSYNNKHNEANGENNRDGTDDNRSWNCGAEGETDDKDVLALRARQARNLLATLVLSMGTPMLTAGDELWRTQDGNNNAYCQDNELTWLDWAETPETQEMLAFTQRLIGIRSGSPALRQPQFFEGRTTPSGEPDLVWFRQDGAEMSEEDWFDDQRRTLAMWIDGANCLSRTRKGELISDDSWLILLHAGAEAAQIVLPAAQYGPVFQPVLDSGSPEGAPEEDIPLPAGKTVTVPGKTMLLFRVPRNTGVQA